MPPEPISGHNSRDQMQFNLYYYGINRIAHISSIAFLARNRAVAETQPNNLLAQNQFGNEQAVIGPSGEPEKLKKKKRFW